MESNGYSVKLLGNKMLPGENTASQYSVGSALRNYL